MDFLKEIFGDKALTYAELEAALKGSTTVKLGNLAGGAYVGKDKFDAEHTRAEGLAQQLTAANTKLSGYDPEWKAKADAAAAAA